RLEVLLGDDHVGVDIDHRQVGGDSGEGGEILHGKSSCLCSLCNAPRSRFPERRPRKRCTRGRNRTTNAECPRSSRSERRGAASARRGGRAHRAVAIEWGGIYYFVEYANFSDPFSEGLGLKNAALIAFGVSLVMILVMAVVSGGYIRRAALHHSGISD